MDFNLAYKAKKNNMFFMLVATLVFPPTLVRCLMLAKRVRPPSRGGGPVAPFSNLPLRCVVCLYRLCLSYVVSSLFLYMSVDLLIFFCGILMESLETPAAYEGL